MVSQKSKWWAGWVWLSVPMLYLNLLFQGLDRRNPQRCPLEMNRPRFKRVYCIFSDGNEFKSILVSTPILFFHCWEVLKSVFLFQAISLGPIFKSVWSSLVFRRLSCWVKSQHVWHYCLWAFTLGMFFFFFYNSRSHTQDFSLTNTPGCYLTCDC